MEGKYAKFMRALEAWGPMRCVTCGGAMTPQDGSLKCPNGHTVNINRKGLVNLLSRQAEGCYDAELFAARSRVLSSGCYDAVADAILSLIPKRARTVLDAGCGEGWYLNRLLILRPDLCGMGVDISRDAILGATNHPCAALWCVADLRSLPAMTGTVDVLLDVLTPASYAEFTRVLAPGGILIKVYPGGNYLREIREAAGMPLYEEGRVEDFLREKARVLQDIRVTVTNPVTPQLWSDFVRMTPLLQDLSSEQKASLPAGSAVTVDLHVTAATLSR